MTCDEGIFSNIGFISFKLWFSRILVLWRTPPTFRTFRLRGLGRRLTACFIFPYGHGNAQSRAKSSDGSAEGE